MDLESIQIIRCPYINIRCPSIYITGPSNHGGLVWCGKWRMNRCRDRIFYGCQKDYAVSERDGDS